MNEKSENRLTMILSLCMVITIASIFSCDLTANAEPFGYSYVRTLPVVTADSTDAIVDVADTCNTKIDLMIAYSASDFRMLVHTPYTADVYGDEYESVTLVAGRLAARLDSLFGIAAVFPAAGKAVYGRIDYLISPAPTDTIWVDFYRMSE